MSERHRVNAPTVVSEILDGEAIIMRLDSGNYYSLSGAGVTAWKLLEQGRSLEAVVAGVAAVYAGEREVIETAIRDLVAELVASELIVIETGPEPEESAPAVPTDPLPEFEAPRLSEYTDMQDLLLVDPIHEVEEAGWPQAVPEPAD